LIIEKKVEESSLPTHMDKSVVMEGFFRFTVRVKEENK